MSFLFIILPFWRLAHVLTTHRQFTVWGVLAILAVALLVGNMLFKAHGLMHATRHKEYKIL